jgi:coenzyme F420-0:L-glutamate ligase/coenzyme F420-1:gamma-L-glutamate ligase
MSVEVVPLEGLPEVRPGDDLAALLEGPLAAEAANDGDVVAVTQKVVSKAEGRIVPDDEREAWVERESVGVVARRGDLLITRTRHGFVCANAGIDASNVRRGFLTLLPEDPDASAERLQKELCARLGLSRFGVVVTDTFGRPWREGVVDVAIGGAGLPALIDLRGTHDDQGRTLETTVVAFADAVAAASGLVMTKTARVPAALVRGLDVAAGGAPPGPARALIRAPADDLFRASALETIASLGSASTFAEEPVPPEIVEEAVGAASARTSEDAPVFVGLGSRPARRRFLAAIGEADDAPLLLVVCIRDPGDGARSLLQAGAAIDRLRLALATRQVGSSWRPIDHPDGARDALSLDAAWRPVAIVRAGPTTEGETFRPRPPATDRLRWRR